MGKGNANINVGIRSTSASGESLNKMFNSSDDVFYRFLLNDVCPNAYISEL
ncbi:hypothetical protein Ct9H90mP29_17560 [bacterium]|nr:MAG: hypothetical protein Ct9H90mP29_17560 [bacterium]